MEKLTQKDEIHEEKKKGGFFKNLGAKLTEAKALAKKERVLIFDLLLFAVGLLFSRCHIAFGAYPLATALVASLSSGVFSALLGAAAGALTLGRSGIIIAISAAITAFIRVIISSGSENGESRVFSENLLLRMCSSVIGGFICAVYELLLRGLNETSVLYGVSMILLPPLLTFLFSGVFLGGFSPSSLIFGSRNLLSLTGKSERERYNIIFFEISAISLLFFLTYSLTDIQIFGISFAFIFLFFSILLTARRFGALRALTVGFIASLGVSGVYSVSFGLLGLASGGLFGFGIGYGLIGGGIAATLWGGYSSGIVGVLSVLPEYSIAAILAFPMLRRLSPETTVAENETEEKYAKDMIGTMALVYQKKYSENLDALSAALDGLADILKKSTPAEEGLDYDDIHMTVMSVASEFCSVCPGRDYCRSENINPCAKNAGKLAKKILNGEKPTAQDINLDDEFCQYPEEVAQAIVRAVAKAEKESYKKRAIPDCEGYALISDLISEARKQDEAERAVNNYKSEQLLSVISEFGFAKGAGRAFGDRRLHLFVAGEDRDGEKITSEKMRKSIESKLGMIISDAEYFRRDSMVLMECSCAPLYSCEYASALSSGEGDERSGDTVSFFTTGIGFVHCLISDGMGRGAVAADTSRFVADFLEKMLTFSASYETVIHLLNRALRKRTRECSATVDLFALDSYSGEVTFIKSGAAPSYVKREGSIFRIRSKTAPLGLLSTIDTEKIKVEVRPTDYIIMLSDGICQSGEECPWLLELLSKPPRENLKEYAELILREAKKNENSKDDMSVAVLRIKELSKKE